MGATEPTDGRRLRVAILGSSGSLGRQALSVCRDHSNAIEVVALAVNRDVASLVRDAHEFDVGTVAVADTSLRDDGRLAQLPASTRVLWGDEGVCELARLEDVDCVLVAVAGAKGLGPARETLLAGKRLALANKESLVAAGALIMPLAKEGQLIPVDSEHSAIFQCLQGEVCSPIRELWLTCSGGPFYGWSRERLSKVTPADALAHPTWTMGPKITIDSADLMNKGLEVIEATWLFDLDVSKVRVLIHPQSLVHSMVTFEDGATKAQLGRHDMRVPIQYAFTYPARWPLERTRMDWRQAHRLTFDYPDLNTFRCLALALEAARVGGTVPCAMNAANEEANAAFLAGKISLTDIDVVVEVVMDATTPEPVTDFAQVDEVERRAREAARAAVAKLCH